MSFIAYDPTKVSKLGIPEAFNERCAVRCLEYEFGTNKKGKPMVTTKWELCGYLLGKELKQELVQAKKTYRLGGLSIRPKYFTMSMENMGYYAELYNLAHPDKPFTGFDDEAPELEWLDGLIMQALVTGKSNPQRRALTDDERAAKVEAGEEPIGEILTDENGEEIDNMTLEIRQWYKKYNGEIESF